jgi:hypothetical protein
MINDSKTKYKQIYRNTKTSEHDLTVDRQVYEGV